MPIISMAVPERRVLSETMALVMGRARVRRAGTSSSGMSQAPPLQRVVRVVMLAAMVSHVSSVSATEIFGLRVSN